MTALLALAPVATWSFADLAIAVLIFLGICAVVWLIVTKVFGVQIPPWLIYLVGIVVGVVVGIWAIKFIAAQA